MTDAHDDAIRHGGIRKTFDARTRQAIAAARGSRERITPMPRPQGRTRMHAAFRMDIADGSASSPFA